MRIKKNAHEETPPELLELADQVGRFMEYWGFKKIHGHLWVHIYLAKKPLDATTLVRRLRVSKALVSLASRDLLNYNVIRVVGQGERGRIFFESNPDLIKVISSVLRMRERKLLAQIGSSHKNLQKAKAAHPECANLDETKIQKLGEMIRNAEDTLDALINSDLILPVLLGVPNIKE
jgi:DNA-binding transcriptional regulator GbsR (MarR family)